MNEPLQKLPLKTVMEILQELEHLCRCQRRGEDVSIPSITLMLDSGHTITGEIVNLDLSLPAMEQFLMIRSGALKGNFDITYLPVAAVRALTIHCTNDDIYILSFGKLKKREVEVPGRLELDRAARSLSDKIARIVSDNFSLTIDWEILHKSDETNISLKELLKALEKILMEVVSDEMGIEAMRKSIKEIKISVSNQMAIDLTNGTLKIDGKIDGNDLELPNATELKRRIEALL